MTRKKYYADWDEEPRRDPKFPNVASDIENQKDDLMNRIDYLISILEMVRNTQKYSLKSFPAEFVFSLLKEIMVFSTYFFSEEHHDIWARNPSFRIVYRTTTFHGIDGNRQIDTGLPENQSFVNRKIQTRKELILNEFFGDLTQDLIELERAYFNNTLSAFFSERHFFGHRSEKTLVQPQRSIQREIFDKRIFYLRRRVKKLEKQRPSKGRRHD